ncbi:MAG: hypothetical protein MI810_10590 [Flavobacteriales bacterium]|nr:hypothetical protein [Flavobacteriales bacterium]
MGIACQETFMVIEERPFKETFSTLFELLKKHELYPCLDEYEPILLNDTEEEEFETIEELEVYPKSHEEAYQAVLEHPTGGIIAFDLGGYVLNFSPTCLKDHTINAISIWIHDSAYREDIFDRYNQLIDDIHLRFGSLRTIQGWNMMDFVDSEEDEVLRVYKGDFKGEYKLDLRGEIVITDRRKNGEWFE